MKAITAKHYKKLPEVQQKMIDNKERQIKLANRLLADMFNKVGGIDSFLLICFFIMIVSIDLYFFFLAESKRMCLKR